MKLSHLILPVLMLCTCLQASAQMTDDQVIAYIKQAHGAGKGEQQIGRELLGKGVTPAQIERLKSRYEESQGSSVQAADQTIGGQVRERRSSASDDLTAGSMDGVALAVTDPTQQSDTVAVRLIFGHDIFSGRTLTFEPNENIATPENYRLGPGDEVIIDIWGANEDTIRQTISPEGDIMVSQIGPVFLNGLTIKEANRKIRNVFARKYAGISGEEPDSDVRVTLGQIRTIQINVLGEVATPGTYRLSSFATVLHALYKAGGVTAIGSLRNVEILRGGKHLASLDLYDYIFRGKLSNDIRLQEGDAVMVPPYELLVDISGNVKRPMYYEMKQPETLADLIDYAGGFTGDAYTEEVRLTRQTGREYQLFNVDEARYATYRLEDGDAVSVGATLDRFANRVEVRGAVYRPGMYELGDRIRTVGMLIARADGVMEDAFLTRVQLYREREDLSLEMVAVDLQGILDGRKPDVVLRRNDVLVVPSIHELEERGAFTVTGQVARPGVYPYAENTTLEDLIIQAGGLLEGASTVKVEVSRRLKDPKSTESTSELSRVYTFSLKDGYVIDGKAGFKLEPYDMVMVRKSPGYQVQQSVTVDGEVVFPGAYTLTQKNERLSDLIKRSGGTTDDAYLRGARLIRQMNDEERAVRDETIRLARSDSGSDSLAVAKLSLQDTYTVGIELDKALANPGSDYDMVLREGDRLVVPEHVSTVRVTGDVMRSNTILYIKGKGVKYYIQQAGGYGSRAKKGKVYIVYMNGTMARTKRLGRTAIEPGCEIIVPSKRARRSISLGEIMGLTTSAASLGTMAASIANLSK